MILDVLFFNKVPCRLKNILGILVSPVGTDWTEDNVICPGNAVEDGALM